MTDLEESVRRYLGHKLRPPAMRSEAVENDRLWAEAILKLIDELKREGKR
jgi:hypothetical protein